MRFMLRFITLILGLALLSFSATSSLKTETFEFSSNGVVMEGKIFLPASYETNRNLPAIYLIDFTEQQFKLATDEFEKVVAGVRSRHRANDSFSGKFRKLRI